MEVKEEKAITLIALIITIIILLILAGISIATLTGENGILKKASSAGEQTKIAEYKEILIIIGNGLRSEKILEDLSTKEYMDRYQEAIEKEIEKGDTFEGAKVERKSEGTIIVTTKEGYIYVVTEDEVKFLGKEGETTPPDLQESNVNFILSPDSWTNQDVRVEIKSTIEGYSIQYSLDGTTWENYKEAITVKENGTIYARLINELEETGGSATKNINIIVKDILPVITVANQEKWTGKEGKKVKITTRDGWITKYTIDGSEPSVENGQKYEKEITITKNCTIKAVYVYFNKVLGKIATEEITKIDTNAPTELRITRINTRNKNNVSYSK